MSSIGALNIHEVARALKIDEDSVNRLVLGGEIPAAKLNDEWIFLQEDILTSLRAASRRKLQSDPVLRRNLHLAPQFRSPEYVDAEKAPDSRRRTLTH
jgi:hypothetical protein